MNLDKQVEKEVNEFYKNIGKVAKDFVNERTKEIDDIIKTLSKDIQSLSDSDLMNYQIKLDIACYYLAETKEYANLKSDCANALYKEKQAIYYLGATGTQESKKNESVINSTDNQVVNILYTNISKLLNTKLEEAKRISRTLSSVSIYRMSLRKQSRLVDKVDSEEVVGVEEDVF